MALTDTSIKNAKLDSDELMKKMFDGGGLFLLVKQNKKGIGKYWRLAYRFAGKQKELALGTYPQVSLKEARDKAYNAKKLLEQHVDPSQKKKDDRRASIDQLNQKEREAEIDANTFEVVGRKWHEHSKYSWTEEYATTIIGRLQRYMFPKLGNIPIAQVTKLQVSNAIEDIVKAGVIETAKRTTQYTRNILEYACDKGYIDAIPLGQTKNLVPAITKKHLPAIVDPKEVGALLRAIDGYKGTFITCSALKLLPYIAVRSKEFRESTWAEFDLKNGLWTIPSMERKQTKEEKENPDNFHLVPLSRQAVTILKSLKSLTGSGNRVFPSVRGDSRPMSENTINGALHALGYKDEMVGHGFRTVFSTLLNTQGFNPDAIERQLAHKEPNAVRAAYNRAEYLQERIKMMQHWADYLDELRGHIA